MATNPIAIMALLHGGLLRVKAIPPELRPGDRGICRMLDQELRCPDREHVVAVDRMLARLFERWPNGTGSAGFPVPAPDPQEAWAGTAFYRAQGNGTIWQGEYGDKRCELLDWLIEQTKV